MPSTKVFWDLYIFLSQSLFISNIMVYIIVDKKKTLYGVFFKKQTCQTRTRIVFEKCLIVFFKKKKRKFPSVLTNLITNIPIKKKTCNKGYKQHNLISKGDPDYYFILLIYMFYIYFLGTYMHESFHGMCVQITQKLLIISFQT